MRELATAMDADKRHVALLNSWRLPDNDAPSRYGQANIYGNILAECLALPTAHVVRCFFPLSNL
jgi:hypothetical protein